MRAKFGTLEWGERSCGVLTRPERFHFLRNMAFLAAREVTDVIRTKLGLLKPINLELSDLAPPDTRMVKDVEEHADVTHTQDLLSHSYRTYYFGAMLAAYHKFKYDRETFFAAAPARRHILNFSGVSTRVAHDKILPRAGKVPRLSGWH